MKNGAADGDTLGSAPGKVRAFQIILSLVICTEYWVKALNAWDELVTVEFVALAGATLLAAVVVHDRWRRAGLTGFAVLQLAYVCAHFPHTGNHRYLELVFLAVLAFLRDDEDDEVRLTLRSLRWMDHHQPAEPKVSPNGHFGERPQRGRPPKWGFRDSLVFIAPAQPDQPRGLESESTRAHP